MNEQTSANKTSTQQTPLVGPLWPGKRFILAIKTNSGGSWTMTAAIVHDFGGEHGNYVQRRFELE